MTKMRCPKCGEELPAFGFTREDVEMLRYPESRLVEDFGADLAAELAARWTSLAARIEALLPPAPPEG